LRDDEIDRILGGEPDVRPSAGFHDAVMEAVHREARALPPIPFPWRRAWPALAAAALAVVGATVLFARSGAATPETIDALRIAAGRAGVSWIALAAASTAGSLLLSRRLAGERI